MAGSTGSEIHIHMERQCDNKDLINKNMKTFKTFLNERKIFRSTRRDRNRIIPSFQHETGDIQTKNQFPDLITGTHYIGRDMSQIAKSRFRRARKP